MPCNEKIAMTPTHPCDPRRKAKGLAWFLVLSLALAGLFGGLGGCDEDPERAKLFATKAIAPSLSEDDVRNLKHLGPTLVDRGANFSVYSEAATRVELLLFSDPESSQPTWRVPMERFGDVWNLYVEGIGVGQHYGYVAWGPNWEYDPDWYPGSIKGFIADVDDQGHRFNPNKLLFDPYSLRLHREHDWGKGSLASGPDRTAKSVILKSEYVWSEHEVAWRQKRQSPDFPGHNWQDMIVYEVQPKGFTASPASGTSVPGTYRAIGEKAAYLKDLGITAVELMPVMEKPSDGTYWGYNTLNFFAPEREFASQSARPHDIIDEFKWMVDQLHQNGIEVILDVVYNHTGEGGFWRSKIALNDFFPGDYSKLGNYDDKLVASIYSYRGLDNAAYYYLQAHDKGQYMDQTGVGNQTRTNHAPMRKLIIDNLRFWVEEMHVDGFRFDLATVLGIDDQDPGRFDPKNSVLQDIIDDPVMRQHKTRIIAEPWHLGHYHPGGFPASDVDDEQAWYEWNGRFRDIWRSFVNYDEPGLNADQGGVDIGGTLTGSAAMFAWNGRKPYHSVNFITAHDGFTLYDLVSYNEKNNLCGLLNPICCDNPTSPFCDPNSGDDHNHSRDWSDERVKRQMIRNFFVALFVAHGTPMMLGGDEWMRTQHGNNNAYSTRADNPYNWFDWGGWSADKDRVRMHDFVRKMIQLRKDHAYAFAPTSYEGAAPMAWKHAGNGDMDNWGGRAVMQHYWDSSVGPELLVLINMDAGSEISFTLPDHKAWERLVDTQLYFDSPEYLDTMGSDAAQSSHNIWTSDPEVVTGAYGVKSRTIVILRGVE